MQRTGLPPKPSRCEQDLSRPGLSETFEVLEALETSDGMSVEWVFDRTVTTEARVS